MQRLPWMSRLPRMPLRWLWRWRLLRFLGSLSQSEAALALGMRRTTLAYQELRITELLRKFLLEDA